jgi:hypothetical protein
LPLLQELQGHSIGIIEHRYPRHRKVLEQYGTFNVGWLAFRRDQNALQCVQWWRDRCIEWCYDRIDGDRFGDQKYLNEWPLRFQGVRVIHHKGANLAPWNYTNHRITLMNGRVLIDDDPLIFFHFHGFKQLNKWVYDTNLQIQGLSELKRWNTKSTSCAGKQSPLEVIQSQIFGPYITELNRSTPMGLQARNIRNPEGNVDCMVRHLKRIRNVALGILFQTHIVFVHGRIVHNVFDLLL